MNTDMLIVGGDGDLALRKLYPALYYLELNGCMPENTNVVGTARTAHEPEEFLATVHAWLKENVPEKNYDEAVWQKFSKRLHFERGDATKPDDLKRIKEKCLGADHQLVVYLAVPPKIFGAICTSLEACGLAKSTTRLVVEKPLGDSKESFMAINAELSRVFTEKQLFRIDHYLGKESVQNLLALRFANDIFEPLWNSKYIDHIQITVTETVGTGNRWDFYDETGATRDMIQNHLLQVLCLVCMEPPSTLEADYVRGEKLKIVRCLKPISMEDVDNLTVRGQYEAGIVNGEKVPGYLNEGDEKRESDTETYVALKAEIMNWRWSGTPVYLRTGKRLNKRHSEIVIQFKQNNHQIFGERNTLQVPNQLIIHLQPDEGIRLRVMNKVAGLDETMPLEDRYLDLSFSDNAKAKKHDAYTRVLHDVFRNDQTLFVSAAEVEAAWEWVDQIFEGWRQKRVKPAGYEAGSTGPVEAIEFMARDGRRWHGN
jgi:glucose-6-phosphate 1-dehydrogenase